MNEESLQKLREWHKSPPEERRRRTKRNMADAERNGFKRLPPDHPIYSEGPTIMFFSHSPSEPNGIVTLPEESKLFKGRKKDRIINSREIKREENIVYSI